jgi:heat shock protein HslJ
VLALPLLLVACGSPDPATDPAALQGVDWVLDSASAGSLVTHVPKDAVVDLRFQDGQAQGSSSCNTYGGSYDAKDDGSLSFGALRMTAMACEQPLMALESAYTTALGSVSGFQVTGTGLVLTGGTVALTFTSSSPGGQTGE